MGFGGNFSDLKDLISCGQKLVAVEPSYWVVKHETAIRGLPKKPPYSNNLFRTINIFSKFSDVDVNEAISIGILVVNNDQACRNKVAEVLRRCNYQVLHTGTVYDALHAIWENKERLDIVVTNAQMLEREGLAIIQNIKQKLKTNVLLIGGDERVGLKGELFSFSAYRLNGLSVNGFNSLLGNARRMEEEKMVSNAAVETNMASSSINDKEHVNKKQKGVELYEERSEDSREDHRRSKKSRVTWTNEMHQRFLDAIERLGYDKAVPKKIVEVMGVPGLTRENVASHLQKYRCSMRRTQETVFGPFSCRSTRIDLEGFASLTSPTLENNLQSTSTSKDFAFCSLPDRKFYSRIGGSHLMDKMRNMDQCQDKSSSSRKFVGYRFEGNKIDFGPERKMNRDALFSATSHVQHNPLLDSQFAEGPFQCHQQVSRTHGTEPDLLSSYAPKFEDQNPFQQPQVSVQQLGDCSDQNTLLQSWDMPETANAAPFDNPPENASTPSHQGFPVAGATGIDLTGRSPAAFVDDVLQAPSPPLPQMLQHLDEIFGQRGNDDDSVMNGMGNSYEQFDFPELDDTLFRQDN